MLQPRRRVLTVLSFVAAAVPFAFALIRASTTGYADFRYLWMAIVAFAGALLVARRRVASAHWLVASVAALVVATALAGAMGFVVGARKSISIWIVAVAFGACEACAVAFRLLATRNELG